MLEVRGLEAGYGGARVLFGVDLAVDAGEAVTLLGRNGMGKTTTVKSVAGILRPSAGSIRFRGREFAGAAAHRIGRAGLGLVPEGRQVFPTLTVEENLVATARRGGAWDLARVWALFPAIAERRHHLGAHLSGGEQQMVAIGRALMTNPELLVLDEATEGLAPVVRAEIWRRLADLKAAGQAILVVDKNLDALARLADRHVVLERGRVVWRGTSAELAAERARVEAHLHV